MDNSVLFPSHSFESIVLSSVVRSIIDYSNDNAFFINGRYYKYYQLAERISAIRKVLYSLFSSGQVFSLVVRDDLDTYASIFALWMEGKAYVPLHPEQPLERNLDIVNQVESKYILDSDSTSIFATLDISCEVLCSSTIPFTGDYLYDWSQVGSDDLAYILFTSGSTGIPKGVCITRENLSAFIDSFWKTGISITHEDRCLQCFDLTFDVSVQSFLVALSRGACVFTVPFGQVKYLYVASLIQNKHITFGALAPSMLSFLQPYFDELDATSLKTSILTAEACPVDLLESWFKCAINTDIYDFYGPTEATIYCTYYKLNRVGENLSYNGIISIGKPLTNVNSIIIREDGSLASDNEKGELCVAGLQITSGYWKNPEKNNSSFFIYNGQRFYHTGDLCFRDKSGNILYSGRIDQQAKIQGFRVELGEIEHHARQYYHNTRRVIAIAFQNKQNITEIALYVESQEEDVQMLIDYLRHKIPYYMVPTRVLFKSQFPLNKSEKIDRNALIQAI